MCEGNQWRRVHELLVPGRVFTVQVRRLRWKNRSPKTAMNSQTGDHYTQEGPATEMLDGVEDDLRSLGNRRRVQGSN